MKIATILSTFLSFGALWIIIGNLWHELWETAKPLPAVEQAPLFDEDLAV